MNLFSGFLFFYVLVLLLIPAAVLGLMGKKLKWYGFAVTLAFTAMVFSTPGKAAFIIGFYILQLLLVMSFLAIRNKVSEKWLPYLLGLFVFLSVSPIILAKLSGLLGLHLEFLGVSYMTFRAVQLLIEIRDGFTTDVKIMDFTYFLLFFPSVSSGPVDRYRRFLGDINGVQTREEYWESLQAGVRRMFTGALYNFVIAGLLQQYVLAVLPDTFLGNWGYMYGYTIFLFFNFAGYSKMAIGAGYILGVRMPENFNMPFLSHDLKDFWARWHISLSTWLRDYVYTRFVRESLRKKWFKDRHTGSYIGYVLTMMTMGVWHGLDARYLFYGAYHGLLMCLNDVLDNKWKRFKKLKKDPVWEPVLVLITFHIVSFGLLVFSGRVF